MPELDFAQELLKYGTPGLIILILLGVIRHLFCAYETSLKERISFGEKMGDALVRSTEGAEALTRTLSLQANRLEMLLAFFQANRHSQ